MRAIHISSSGWRGSDLIRFRDLLDWTQGQLATAIGLASATSISFWENDPRAASKVLSQDKVARLEEIAKQHQIDIVYRDGGISPRPDSIAERHSAETSPSSYEAYLANSIRARLDVAIVPGAMKNNGKALSATLAKHAPDRVSGILQLLLFTADGFPIASSHPTGPCDTSILNRLTKDYVNADIIRVMCRPEVDSLAFHCDSEIVLISKIDRRGMLWLLGRVDDTQSYLPGIVRMKLAEVSRDLRDLISEPEGDTPHA